MTFAVGCGDSGGGGSGVVSCTVSNSAFGSTVTICEEVPASQGQQLEQSCMNPGAAGADAGIGVHATDGPCSRVGALGGCSVTQNGVTVTGWWYADIGGSPDDIKQLCAEVRGTFVAP